MPPRVDLTPELALARAERKRVSDREAQRRRRARQHDAAAVSMTRQHDAAPESAGTVSLTPPPPAPPPSVVPTEPPAAADDLALIRRELQRFAERGYQHDDGFWQRLAGKCPDVDLVLEAAKLAEWLQEPKHSKEACSKRRIDNWAKRAQADADQRRLAPGPVAPLPPPRGMVVNGTYHPPAAFQSNREKNFKSGEDYSPEELSRSDEARQKVLAGLPERLRGKSRWRAG